jgi:hypothetical protein
VSAADEALKRLRPRVSGRTVRTISTLAGLIAWAAAVSAAESTLPTAIEACASLPRDLERLACYDRAVAALRAGQEVTAATAESMFGTTRDLVGGSPEQRGLKQEELKQISGTVISMRYSDDGMITLELDNGQVWRQQDSSVRLMVAKGDQVTIVRASMGTFRIADKSGRFARFKRVR